MNSSYLNTQWQVFLLLVGWMSVMGSLIAQPTKQSFTLDESIQYALSNNKNIQNARFDEYIAKARVREITGLGLPQLSASADIQYFAKLPTSILPGDFNPKRDPNGNPLIDPETGQPIPGDPVEVQFGFPWNSTAGFQLNQLVADGTFFLGLRAARVYVELSQKNTALTQEDIALQVSKAYFQALIAQERLNLVDANLKRIEKLYSETKILNETGFAEKIDVDRLQITFTNLEIEKSKLERFAGLSRDLLKFQMGMPVNTDLTLTESIEDIEAGSIEDLSFDQFDYSQRIEYSLLETQKELENYNMRRYRVGHLPSLYAFGSYQWNAQRNEFNLFNGNERWFPISVVGLQLNVPIFDGLQKHYQVQQSKLAIRKIENNFEILENSINLELRSSRSNLLNAANNLEVYKRNRDLAQKVFDVSEIKYKEGVGSSLEVNDSESTLKEAESNYLSGLFEYLMAKIELQKARGEFSKYHQNQDQ